MLSETEQEPPLTKKEILKLQKLISKCLDRHSKQVFQKVSDIQKYIPECKKTEYKKKKLLPFCTSGYGTFRCVCSFRGEEQKVVKGESKKESVQVTNGEESATDVGKEELELELALLYFLNLQDYEESLRHLQQVKSNPAAENLEVIARSLGGGMVSGSELKEALHRLEKEVVGKDFSEEQEEAYYECLLKGYALLTEEEDMKELLRIGQAYEQMVEEVPTEILLNMADASEKCGQYKEAFQMYERVMEHTTDAKEKETLYEKQAQVAALAEMPEKGYEILREGIREFPESVNLRTVYIKQQCEDTSIDRAVCMVAIGEAIKELPAILEDVQFQKLMKEYGFKVEGEKVWKKIKDVVFAFVDSCSDLYTAGAGYLCGGFRQGYRTIGICGRIRKSRRTGKSGSSRDSGRARISRRARDSGRTAGSVPSGDPKRRWGEWLVCYKTGNKNLPCQWKRDNEI